MKLSPAQWWALNRLAEKDAYYRFTNYEVYAWGELVGRWVTPKTIRILQTYGLVSPRDEAGWAKITEAGRQALAEAA